MDHDEVSDYLDATLSVWRWIPKLWNSRKVTKTLCRELLNARLEVEQLEREMQHNKKGTQKVVELIVRRGWFDNERQNIMEKLLIDRR